MYKHAVCRPEDEVVGLRVMCWAWNSHILWVTSCQNVCLRWQ